MVYQMECPNRYFEVRFKSNNIDYTKLLYVEANLNFFGPKAARGFLIHKIKDGHTHETNPKYFGYKMPEITLLSNETQLAKDAMIKSTGVDIYYYPSGHKVEDDSDQSHDASCIPEDVTERDLIDFLEREAQGETPSPENLKFVIHYVPAVNDNEPVVRPEDLPF